MRPFSAIITPNETEAELLTGHRAIDGQSAAAAADRLLSLGPVAAVITLGGAGAFVRERSGAVHVPAFAVTPVDTVAAGDVFNGCLAVAVAEGRSLVESVRFASAAAAISVTRQAAQDSAPTRREIEALCGRPSQT